jgi:hypothetical protein
LAEAQRRLEEWRGIELVVPSLEAAVRRVPEAPGDEVTIRSDQWRLLVAIAAEMRVQGVIDRSGMGEFDTCRTIKELVEAGLAEVDMLSAEPTRATSVAGTSADGGKAAAKGETTVTQVASPSDDELVELPKRKPRTSPSKAKAPAEPKPEPDEADALSPVSLSAAAAAADELPEAEAKVLVQQLAALGDDAAAAKELARRVVAGEDLGDGDDEPINRGLLLKFLSSVRS